MSISNRSLSSATVQLGNGGLAASIAAETVRALAAEAALESQIGAAGGITYDGEGNGSFQDQDDVERFVAVFETPPIPTP